MTWCLKRQKVFCSYCRYAKAHTPIKFSTHGDPAFTSTGFDNYKKLLERFGHHASSAVHRESTMPWSAAGPSIQSRLSSQQLCCEGLQKQLLAMKILMRQGLAMRGHHDTDGNLYQLLCTWATDNEVIATWLKQGRLMLHDHVNELISLMRHHQPSLVRHHC